MSTEDGSQELEREVPGGTEGDAAPELRLESPPNEPMVAGLYVESAHFLNYRGLADCSIEFEPDLTVLLGMNNVGKSRILRGLAIALGALPAERDDLTAGGAEPAVVDIILAPPSVAADGLFDKRVARRLVSVYSIGNGHERFAWRTAISSSLEGMGVRVDHKLLLFDERSQEWILPDGTASLAAEQRRLISAHFIEPRRDLVEDLTRRGSPIRRVFDDLEIASVERDKIETSLRGVSEAILSASGSLAAVKGALDQLARSVGGVGIPELQALPVKLEEIARAVSVDLDAGGGSLPIRFHGSGARSLASLQLQSVLYDRRVGRDSLSLRPHPVSLVEEPEAHLHPQAQFELASILTHMTGQKIVTSHSAHLATEVQPRSLRLMRTSPEGMPVLVDLRPSDDDSAVPRARRPSLHLAEMEKLKRLIERPFGELLFARAIVLGDGATERAFLPPLIRSALGARGHGVCVVDTGSMASELASAVVKFAQLVGVPLVAVSDSDKSGVDAVAALKSQCGLSSSSVVWVPGPPGDSVKAGAATEQMMLEFDATLCMEAARRLGYTGQARNLISFMKQKKGVIGGLLAEGFLSSHPWLAHVHGVEACCWPEPLCQLVSVLDLALSREVASK